MHVIIRAAARASVMGCLLSLVSANAQLFNGLVGYWNFNEGVGVVARDSSGNGNDATLIQGAGWSSEGRFGGALDLRGETDAAQVAVPSAMPLGNSPRTIAGWMYVTGENEWPHGQRYQTLAGYGSPLAGTHQPFALERGGDVSIGRVYQLGWDNDLAGNTANGIPLLAWTHVAVTFDGSTVSLYLNGMLDGEAMNRGFVSSLDDSGLLLGDCPPNDGWHANLIGLIDDVAIWNRALSPSEIGSISSGQVAVPEPGGTAAVLLLTAVISAARLRRHAGRSAPREQD